MNNSLYKLAVSASVLAALLISISSSVYGKSLSTDPCASLSQISEHSTQTSAIQCPETRSSENPTHAPAVQSTAAQRPQSPVISNVAQNVSEGHAALPQNIEMIWDNNITADPVIAPGQSHLHWKRTVGYYAGALMGNGLLGTNFYKLEDNVYRLNVGRSDVTEARQPYSTLNSARLPIGYFTISTKGKVEDEQMKLSIYDAMTDGCFKTSEGELKFKTFVHATKELIVFCADPSDGEVEWKWDFVPQEAVSPRFVFGKTPDSGYVNSLGHSNPAPHRITSRGVNCLVQPLAKDTTFTEIARYYVVAWAKSRNRVVATVSQNATEKAAVREAVELVRKGLATKESELESDHIDWWHNFYKDAASLTFPDKEIENFYWFQYYKFACCARPGKPIVDLQGVWPTYDTPWPAIWMNLNIQLTYSWLTKANLGFLAQPLWDSFWTNRDNLTRNVTDIRGQEDWTECRVMPRSSTYDMHAPLNPSLVDVNSYEVGNLTWTLYYYWQQCLAYGDDFQMRERLFPLLKSAVNMFFRIRIENPDGSYSLPSTASPEYFTDRKVGNNANYDLANLRWGLSTLLSINEQYKLNDPLAPKWQDFLDHLAPFGYDESTGFKISDEYEFEDTTHRHYSHLFMIYPYHLLDWNNPADAHRMQISVDRWNGDTGYSLTGKASMLESKGDGDGALALLKRFLSGWVRPNTLYNESGPVIETPFSAMCSLEEMYLQDWGGLIRVFPACPGAWKDCSFSNMRASGAFLVSAERRDGKTMSVTVHSEKGGVCRIKTGIGEMMAKVDYCESTAEMPSWKALGDGIIELYMSEGETIRISRRKTSYRVNYDEAMVPEYNLPDPLVMNDGSKVQSVSDWETKRRPEIMDMMRREMYGYEPARPEGLHFKILEQSADAFGGKATRKQVAVYFTEDESHYMTVLIYVPNGAQGPVPAFMGMNFRGNHATTEDPSVLMPSEDKVAEYGKEWYEKVDRGSWGRRWPYEYILSRGYAVVTMFYGDVDPDWNDGFHNGVHGLLAECANGTSDVSSDGSGKSRKCSSDILDSRCRRTTESWGTVSAWAWGLSRALDYLETDTDIDASKVAVVGHSRLGKTSLWAGATDQRFAAVFSNCSGCSGAAISRRKFGETVYVVNDAFPHWFCGNYQKYSDNEDALPFDQHELVAMIAPRPVYVSSASEDNWADQKGEYLSLVGAEPVYELYGCEGFTSTEKPAVENPQTAGRMGNHIRRGEHDIVIYDWIQFINFADRFLK